MRLTALTAAAVLVLVKSSRALDVHHTVPANENVTSVPPATTTTLDDTMGPSNATWILICAYFVFTMKTGLYFCSHKRELYLGYCIIR